MTMPIRTLKSMFNPGSIAIIGQGHDDAGADAILERNLINAGFKGPVLPVNPDRPAVAGVFTYPNVASLPTIPELAILTTRLEEGPAVIRELGTKGTRAVLLLSRSRLNAFADAGTALKQALLEAAKPYRLCLLGPDRLGMAIPINGINATLSQLPLMPGHLSLLTQSSSLMRAVMSWAASRTIGFSHLVSVGAEVDVDCSDILDYVAQDSQTYAILMYLESIRHPRRFLSAARTAARLKPIIALKPRGYRGNPVEEGIYDAAARRVGILRVDTIEHLFNAVETLANTKAVRKNRLLILGNSRSMGLLAGDTLLREGGTLAALSEATRAALARLLPRGYYPDNPVDLGDEAGFQEYNQALELLLKEAEADGILIVHVPTASDLDQECSQAIVACAAQSQRLVMISWVGSTPAIPIKRLFQHAQIATYPTPNEAVQSFIQLTEYRRNQELLMETPSSVPEEFTPATAMARRIIVTALAAGQDRLDIEATAELLAAYQIPMISTSFAPTPADAAVLATQLGGSVALKIVSKGIRHRSDVGGVALAVEGYQEVFTAASAMLKRVQALVPEAEIEGFAVQPMLHRRGAYEVAIGVRTGREFKAGPVLFFGHGGTESQVINDIAYALPPLNMHLARELMSRTRLYALLSRSPGRAVNLDALALVLIKVSQMVIDLDELTELDINPLRVDAEGVMALSAHVQIAAVDPATERLAIRPYPQELEQRLTLADGRTLCLRPILPEDEPALQALVKRLSPEDIRLRFFQPLKELSHALAARLTQLDYDREMAFVLADPGRAGRTTVWGVVRMTADPDREQAEYAITLDPTLRGLGLGALLLRRIIDYARNRGIRQLFGEVLAENEAMLKLNRALGFAIKRDPNDPGLMHVRLSL
jgi:acetyltransferase